MNNKELVSIINNNGVAYPADRSSEPRRCNHVPYKLEDLLEQPVSSATYVDIDRARSEGLVTAEHAYNGSVSVQLTYEGHRLYLQSEPWYDEAQWRSQNRRYLCCAKAIPVFCVCIVRTLCPDHGSQCNGSHD